jgi:hypothetical protein
MPRLTFLIVAVLLIVAGLYFLSTRVHEVPTKVIEVEVDQAANAQ